MAHEYMGEYVKDCERMGMKYGPDVYRWSQRESTGPQRLTRTDSNYDPGLSWISLSNKKMTMI